MAFTHENVYYTEEPPAALAGNEVGRIFLSCVLCVLPAYSTRVLGIADDGRE